MDDRQLNKLGGCLCFAFAFPFVLISCMFVLSAIMPPPASPPGFVQSALEDAAMIGGVAVGLIAAGWWSVETEGWPISAPAAGSASVCGLCSPSRLADAGAQIGLEIVQSMVWHHRGAVVGIVRSREGYLVAQDWRNQPLRTGGRTAHASRYVLVDVRIALDLRCRVRRA